MSDGIDNVDDWYFFATDSSPGSQIWSSARGAFVALNDATYLAWVAIWGHAEATFPTIASVYVYLSNVADNRSRDGYGLVDATNSVTLTTLYPSGVIPRFIEIGTSGSGKTVKLPQANLPTGLPLGRPFRFWNNTSNIVSIIDFGSNNIIGLEADESVDIYTTSYASQNGTHTYTPAWHGIIPVDRGGTSNSSIAGSMLTLQIGILSAKKTGINFNSANTDNALALVLPANVIRWRVNSINITNASHDLSTATIGVFTSTGGGGETIAANQAITVTATGANANNNCQALTVTNSATEAYSSTTIQVRIGTAEGVAATGDVVITIIPLT